MRLGFLAVLSGKAMILGAAKKGVRRIGGGLFQTSS
tara:strand:+ start:364 stop:471 length:108 start_codon:yes stop_codon:yes gene_type:complete